MEAARRAGIMPAMQGGGREGEDGGEQDTGVDTFNFVKLGFDETDGEQRVGGAYSP